MNIKRRAIKLQPDPSRVLIRPSIPDDPQRIISIIGRALTLSDERVDWLLSDIMHEFAERHFNIERVLDRHFENVRPHLFTDTQLSRARQLLIGALFTSEFALESGALFNPSIVAHPDQSNLPDGALRFILSLRATGQEHLSSIQFRSGVIDRDLNITLDVASQHVAAPQVTPSATFDKTMFVLKLREMGFENGLAREVLGPMPMTFTLADLQKNIVAARTKSRSRSLDEERALDCMRWLAEMNCEVSFSENQPLSERIIFPSFADESSGIGDARFVRFSDKADENGRAIYYATCTAYNGRVILPQLIETRDFLRFKIVTLNGPAAQSRSSALFPRRIGGRFAMLSRQDDENLFIAFSENIHFWHDTQKLLKPSQAWEFIHLGSCGSPIETERGWLLLTHGVGAMRKYCIGAILLDLENPARVIARLREPLLRPDQNEREGCAPNVVYTCGALLHDRELIIPYAMSDYASSIATVALDELLERLKPE